MVHDILEMGELGSSFLDFAPTMVLDSEDYQNDP